MDDFLLALAYSALPAAGNFAGGLLAERVNVSQRALSLSLHLAVGVIVAVVAVELVPQALGRVPRWAIAGAFVAGALFVMAVDRLVELVGRRRGGRPGSAAWMVWFGVAMDLFSDGLMIGTGSTLATSLGMLLALAQVPADLPEGFATIAAFKEDGMPRRRRLLLGASFTIPILLGTTVGFWAVRGQPEGVKLALLTFTAGVLVTVVIEEMVPLSHQGTEPALAALAFALGFAGFTLLAGLG